jgi:hypothetical protein
LGDLSPAAVQRGTAAGGGAAGALPRPRVADGRRAGPDKAELAMLCGVEGGRRAEKTLRVGKKTTRGRRGRAIGGPIYNWSAAFFLFVVCC